MTEKRFSIKEGSSIGLSSIYTDNGKVMTQLEVLDVLIKQHETIQTLAKENEQLKQFKDKTFNLLDKEIAQNEEAIEVFGKQGVCTESMEFHTNMLKILRKELQMK